MTTLYARRLVLRNCGRFSVVQSDFGADYRTHTHVTGEALYASLTRGETWEPRPIVVKNDTYDFTRDYHVEDMPVWFTPGLFLHPEFGPRLIDEDLDTTSFNAVSAVYPTTSRRFRFDRKGDIRRDKSRPQHVPTYGTWQSVLPDRRLYTLAYSPERELLDSFGADQTFLLGKKRTMFQIVDLSSITPASHEQGQCETGWLQLPPDYGDRFRSFEILTATMRYIIMRGTTREEVRFVRFSFTGSEVNLPDFYLNQIPIIE